MCIVSLFVLLFPFLICLPSLLNFARSPRVSFHTQLDSRQTPVLAVVVTAVEAGTRLSLFIVEHGQDAENDGDAGIELDAHEAVRHGVGDVLEVHSFALD